MNDVGLKKTAVVNLRTDRERVTLRVDRRTRYGNPYRMQDADNDGERELVLRLYECYLRERPDLLRGVRTEMPGEVLGCWCAPKLCHGDILARVADMPEDEYRRWRTGAFDVVDELYPCEEVSSDE